jgi:HEAT repeat protein
MGVETRKDAVRALSDFYGPPVVDALVPRLADSHPSVRRAALDGLATLGLPIATENLLDHYLRLDGEDEADEAEAVLEVLCNWRVQKLPELLVDRLLADGAPELTDRHRDALRALIASDPRGTATAGAVASALIGYLPVAEPEAHARAERMLGWIGPLACDTVLHELSMGTATPAVARAAAGLRDSRLVEPLVLQLFDGDTEMRASAAYGLQGLNDTRAVPALVRATQDDEQSVRDAASAALNSMGMAAVIVGLGELLRPSDTQLDQGLAEIGPGNGEHSVPPTPAAAPPNIGWAGQVVARLLGRPE